MKKLGIIITTSIIAVIALIFILLSNSRLTLNSTLEIPYKTLGLDNQNSSSDKISESNIEVYKDKIIIRIDNASLSKYADTDSMTPSLDTGANDIRIVPKSKKQCATTP